jgi:ELWxxDGT repeat protein
MRRHVPSPVIAVLAAVTWALASPPTPATVAAAAPDATALGPDCADSVGDLTGAGDALFFARCDAGGFELWTSDGTATGTRPVRRWDGARLERIVGGERVFLLADDAERGQQLWTSDGTEPGTVMLRLTVPADHRWPHGDIASPTALAALGSRVFFEAFDAAHGLELWTSDGTPAGTNLVRDVTRGPQSTWIRGMAPLGDRLFVIASQPRDGDQPWVTDGTSGGTRRVKRIVDAGGATGLFDLTTGGSFAWFTQSRLGEDRVWRSDGTDAGTEAIDALRPETDVLDLTPVGDRLFVATDDEWSVWVTDGTSTGTRDVLDWNEGEVDDWADSLVAVGDRLFVAGDHLWTSDGTVAGTSQVLLPSGPDVDDGAAYAPRDLVAFGGQLYFTAVDSQHGRELWTSDGTADGTRLVADIAAGRASSDPTDLTVAGSRLFFLANDGSHGRGLWVSDGSSVGIRLVTAVPQAGTRSATGG